MMWIILAMGDYWSGGLISKILLRRKDLEKQKDK